MASKNTSADAKGRRGGSREVLLRPTRTSGLPTATPVTPRDVPDPLGELPPEGGERRRAVCLHPRERRAPRRRARQGERKFENERKISGRQRLGSGEGTNAQMRAPEDRRTSLLAEVQTRSSRANRREV